MRDKTPRFFPGDGISAGLLHWPSSCGMRSPPGFLRAALPNGRAFCCLDNTPVCERRFGNLKPCFVDVVNHPGPHLALSLLMQDFALGANAAIPLRLIEECTRRKLVR